MENWKRIFIVIPFFPSPQEPDEFSFTHHTNTLNKQTSILAVAKVD